MDLLISGPEGPPTSVELQNRALALGRAPENDLAYPNDQWLSRTHLRFEREDNGWFVKDCRSRNGTVVNATTLKEERHRLKAGDRIYAGHLTIEVRDHGAHPQRNVVSFVPQEEKTTREATIVTSLDKVLGKAATPNHQHKEATLNTSRIVQALIRAGQELAGHQPLEELFPSILNLTLSAMEARRGVILTLEDGELVVRASKGKGFTISTAVRDRVLREKCSLVISDAQLDKALSQQESIVIQKVRSMMAVPLQTGDRVIGLIYVDNDMFIRSFSHEDLDLLTVMANVAAIRIEHARLALVEQSEKLMESELAQASEIQRSLLPTEAPSYEGYDLAGYNLPCHTVGGDYYDFLPYKDGRLALVVGDVSGKGLPAALLMSSLQARVQMLRETSPDPAAAVTILNRNLAERCLLGKFITFFYGLLDPATGILHYSNAGHNYPILLRSNGAVEQLSGSGMIMGVFPSIEYERSEIELKPGDTLALFSDGVTEACTPGGDEFGESGLAQFLAAHKSEPSADLVRTLAEEVHSWCGSPAFADDFTIVLLRRLS
ncbi:MAG: SpoIIE family protein phosphatase [Acidobacteriaceae bacterium]|nr:SpoIIE family protein phosphatase [Acidobacteriaceae bacterium]MBV9294374.1 SpoIIE family protein phosphatase [Acidobacteriaceae bacterium]